MKKTLQKQTHKASEEMASDYHFDYSAARPNRFAEKMSDSPTVVVLDDDVAKVFTTPEAVNKALRALIHAIPEKNTSGIYIREK